MGRLSAVVPLVVLLLACGCEQEKKAVTVTRERSQAVQASSRTPPATEQAAQAKALPTPAEATPRPPRRLCGGRLDDGGPALPSLPLSKEAAPSEPALPELPRQSQGFTWVNFWAAWCEPCKEEIPLLKSWAARLAGSATPLSVVFISIDDDLRQLRGFLQSQPAEGLRSTYWLREGKQREEWFGALELSPDPELPLHLLVDAHGRVRCVVNGAVEPSDYEQLTQLLRN